MRLSITCLALTTFGFAAIANADDVGVEPSSYTAVWTSSDGYERRAVMFPHEFEGCKIMIQSKRPAGSDDPAALEEAEGFDCDCDLRIDDREEDFAAPYDPYFVRKLRGVCQSEGVPADTTKRILNRETLKLKPDFSRFRNVRPG